ncbi:MAG: AtpZ/AtpI family protein [Nitrospirota bacterium]
MQDKGKKRAEVIREVGFFTVIPMVLVAGPLIGFLIGDYLDKKWNTEPWLMLFFVILGGIASIRQIIDIFKKARR